MKPQVPSDDQLVDCLRQGDEEAFARIYTRHVEALIRFSESKLRNLEEARDLVQELFVDL